MPKLGPKAFEQCAGFLRVPDGSNPLDATAVHPESYGGGEGAAGEAAAMRLQALKRGGIVGMLGKAEQAGMAKLAAELGVGETDPAGYRAASWRSRAATRATSCPRPSCARTCCSMKDLKPGMELTGTVRNVIDFGAFVDIGVHQDGLVHISQHGRTALSSTRARWCAVGDVVTVWVVDVDVKKQRIALSMVKGRA